jgi:hypothetical protein
LHGHGLRDRQVLGPLEVGAASTMSIVACLISAWPGHETTSWRTLTRWASAVASGAWPWCRAATGLGARAAAARAAQIAAGLAPPMTAGPIWEQAYAGGAALI